MSNTTAMASRRTGSRTGCGPGSRRVMVTLTEDTFRELQAQADANRHGLSGEAAEAIERDLRRAEALRAGRAS